MSTYTTNYNLEKPDSGDDFKDFRLNYNSNMDIIDANLGGGGGGNVDDVLVNGVSVVDGNHDAQITSYKEVTQAEYDALPSSKLTDGIAYFIKDAGGGGGGSSSHNYSTTEQVIGTWIDGKPVYEITYSITTPSSENQVTIIQDVTSLNMDSIVDIKGMIDNIPINWTQGDANLSACWINGTKTGIAMKVGNSSLTSKSCNVILQYTKTTD